MMREVSWQQELSDNRKPLLVVERVGCPVDTLLDLSGVDVRGDGVVQAAVDPNVGTSLLFLFLHRPIV